MKLMFLNKAYIAQVRDISPCELCMYSYTNCTHIPTSICRQYGGFHPSDTKIFTL
jgi:hypothetical protein